MFPERAQADAATLGGHEGLDLLLVDLDGELGPSRNIDLGLLGALPPRPVQHPLRRRIHGRIAPVATTPVPPTVNSLMRMVGWPTDTGTP